MDDYTKLELYHCGPKNFAGERLELFYRYIRLYDFHLIDYKGLERLSGLSQDELILFMEIRGKLEKEFVRLANEQLDIWIAEDTENNDENSISESTENSAQ